jgi:hypothetical protein
MPIKVVEVSKYDSETNSIDADFIIVQIGHIFDVELYIRDLAEVYAKSEGQPELVILT